MLKIYKISSASAIDFAAEELKKYLRMMLPEGGDVSVIYDKAAKDGFRLGLMQDLGLDVSDAADTDLDDILYIDTDGQGGIIAGDNPRSVLLSVYEYLRQNGCRWLFPGPDGEYVPTVESLKPVSYRHKPSCRYRGPCIEGACDQRTILETVDFIPKVGMNLYMSQFLIPKTFYQRYYDHVHNTVRGKESVTEEQVRSWKLECECEVARRGLQFHDVGHGWTAAPFGIDISTGWEKVDGSDLPESVTRNLAMLKGVRTLYTATLNTQFCMSNPDSRATVANYIAEYASRHSNVDYLHVWLADDNNNHCECPECVKKSVSDWYIMLLNDIDAALAARSLSTRIVFIAYNETTWAPVEERIKNPDRFTLMLAPITRSYTRTMTEGYSADLPPFVLNDITLPRTLDDYMAHFARWRECWGGASLAYEYHFWRHQTYDVSGQRLARRIFEDAEAYLRSSVGGMIACGSQRSYFPNGFAYYVFARKQFDVSLGFEELMEDYYSTAYGEDWRRFADYLAELEDAVGFAYLEGEEGVEPSRPMYNPERAEKLTRVPAILAKGRELIASHGCDPVRVRAASVGLLEYHAEYLELLAPALEKKARGEDGEAMRIFEEQVKPRMSELEPYIMGCFDHYLNMSKIGAAIRYNPKN